jgi:hypothetical protein
VFFTLHLSLQKLKKLNKQFNEAQDLINKGRLEQNIATNIKNNIRKHVPV